MQRKIKCIFINVNSLVSKQKRHYFDIFLKKHKPDIVLIAEHKLNIRHKVEFSGYNIIRQNRSTGSGGGTAICIKENFSYKKIEINLNSVENTAIEVNLIDGSVISFVSMYLRPSVNLSAFDMNKILSLLNSNKFILGGDLNARHPSWGDVSTNANGRFLSDWLNNQPLVQLVPTKFPTRVSTCESFLDIFLTSASLNIEFNDLHPNFLSTLYFESDHNAVELNLLSCDIVRNPPVEVFNFSKMDTELFNIVLENNLASHILPNDRIVSKFEINNCISKLGPAFDLAILASTPKVTIRKKGQLNLSPNILNFIKQKKHLRKMAYRCSDPQRKITLKAIIRNLDTIIKELISLNEDRYWCDFFKKIKMNNKTYKKIKNLCGLNKKSDLPDFIDDSGIVTSDNISKVNLLADNFENVHKQNLNLGTIEFTNFVKNEISELRIAEPILNFNDIFTADGESSLRNGEGILADGYKNFITAVDICFALKFKNNKKSSGEDGISNFVLRKTSPFFWKFCAILFNHIFNLGFFPMSWKCAKIIPILKPNANSKNPKSYRPISLLSNISKLFEEFLLQKIKIHISDKNILKNYQFGFRNYHSTNHALMLLSDYVATNLNKQCATIAVSLDFEKAFDTAWIEGIIYKMFKIFGFEKNLCRILLNYLTDRSFYVYNRDQNSILKSILAGVPQGSLLGPVLYNILLADIPDPDPNTLNLIYADDILILCSKPSMKIANNLVNQYLQSLFAYFNKWKLKLNINKCECTVFKGVKKYIFPSARKFIPSIQINGQILNYKDQLKYLGVILHSKFTFYRHIDFILNKAKKVFFSYTNLLKRAKDLQNQIKLNCYKQIIRPILSYAFPIWFSISSCQMERLRKFERYILRICTGVYWQPIRDVFRKKISNSKLYNTCKIERIDNFLINSAIRFLDNTPNVDNALLLKYFEKENQIAFPFRERYLSPIHLNLLFKNSNLYTENKLLFYHRKFNTYNITNHVYDTSQHTQ